jgi:hypothetical protein
VSFHTWSSKIDVVFPTQGMSMTYKNVFTPTGGNVGQIFWTRIRGNSDSADLKGADVQGHTVVRIEVRDKLREGKIEVWRGDLGREVLEQVVVSAVAELEDHRRKVESQNVNPGIIAAGVVTGFTGS